MAPTSNRSARERAEELRPPRRIIAAGPLTPGFVCTHGGHPPAVGIDGCCLLCGRTPSTSTRAETPPESPARVEAP